MTLKRARLGHLKPEVVSTSPGDRACIPYTVGDTSQNTGVHGLVRPLCRL